MTIVEVYRRPPGEQRSEFEGVDYLHSPRSEQEFQKDLDTLLREYLRAPSVYTSYLTQDGFFVDHQGNKLTDMVEKAVEKRIGQKGYERTWAESAGVFALQSLFWTSNEDDVVVLASPPGLPEEGFGKDGSRMSMTGISLVHPLHGGRKEITTYTVPIPEIEISEHVKILQRSVGADVFETVVGSEYGNHPDRHLVSRPIRIIGGRKSHVEDKLAKELGYIDFNGLKEKVEAGLKLDKDEDAEGRRVGLTSFIAKQIGLYRDNKDEDGLRISGKIIKMMFALEASGEYLGWDLWRVIDEFKSLMHGFKTKEQATKNGLQILYGDERLAVERVDELYLMIQRNDNAKSLLSGSSCGSSQSWQDMFDNTWNELNDFGKKNIIQDLLESKDESYSFDHDGRCVVCKVDPKKLGPCEICEDCDHKIRQQAG